MMSCRWFKKRVKRYSHISCEDYYEIGECIAWPLLPFLLAACAPSAEFKLSLAPGEGMPANDFGHGTAQVSF